MTSAAKNFQIMMTPGRARFVSLVAITSLLTGYIGAAILPEAAKPLDLGLTILKLIGLVSAILLFLSNYGQMSQKREADLDEREAQVRNRAYVLTHQIMVMMLFAAFFYLETAGHTGWWMPPADQASNLITAFALGSMALPAAILAWRDSGPQDDG